MSLSVTTTEVIITEIASSKPMMPIIPMVRALPCQNVRDSAPQMRFKARSITEKTQEPAHNTTMKQVMTIPVPTEDRERSVSRKKAREPG